MKNLMKTMNGLKEKLDRLCDAQSFTTTWYVKDLKSNIEIHRAGEMPVPSQSTRKIVFMLAALEAVHAGRLNLSQRMVIDERLMQGVVSGVFYFMTPGLTIPLRDALVQMIITSDNTCTSLVGEAVGLNAINNYCQRLGMSATLIRELVPPRDMPADHDFDFVAQTSAIDQGNLLQMVLAGSQDDAAAQRLGCSQSLCQLAMEILIRQVYRTQLPAHLPLGTKVAHKTGTGKHGKMDAGIVFRNGKPRFVMTAYAVDVPVEMPDGMPGQHAASEHLARMCRVCWDELGD
ncbi:beta-lactamase class A [Paraburkholderia fungorum]|uniref:beta-lactamase n=1 Tax=Paraburkholderia fungorum TaxID=134537 RepID=A0A1H1JV97_9BURK|nr:serine hydrolase [Paraburkholderia fungorum]SDR53904.1 beta-lactamase class A [Paraburkholderia fungorum]